MFFVELFWCIWVTLSEHLLFTRRDIVHGMWAVYHPTQPSTTWYTNTYSKHMQNEFSVYAGYELA